MMSELATSDQQQTAAALQAEGKLGEAEAVLREVLRKEPGNAQVLHNLGAVLARQDRFEEAAALFVAALELDHSYISARRNLARVLQKLGRHVEATKHFRVLLAASPSDAESLLDLASSLNLSGPPAEAMVLLRHARRLLPDSADICNSLGLACLAGGRLLEAQDAFDEALRLEPNLASAHTNLATLLKEQGRLDEALAASDHALRLIPDSPSARWNRSLILLEMGDFKRGWAEYEWRWRRPASPMKSFKGPVWDGSNLAGKTLLLHAEQGLGDTIQFIRYAALAKERGARVLFQCPSPLAGVLNGCAGVDQLIVEGDPLPAFDVHLPLMSAPHRFGTELSNVPNRVPYIAANPERVEHWRGVLGNQSEYRVGIVWQGNPHHQLDRFRSVPASAFNPLAELPGVKLVSLQRGPGAEQLDDQASSRMQIVEVLGRQIMTIGDWVDTAAVIANLDLVITVDTAPAHMAGALGVPVWLALAAAPDWRWMLHRNDSPWYPTMRLFRQRDLGAWEPVFEKIAAELRIQTQERR